MKKKAFPTLALLIMIVLISCQKESLPEEQVSESNQPETTETLEPLQVDDDLIRLLKTNYYNVGEVTLTDFLLPDGSTEQRYQLEGDITFSKEQIESLKNLDNPTSKNYHTKNLVNPRTLTIVGYNAGNTALSNKQRNALQLAVANYNNLKLGIRFTLNFGSSYQNKDIVVYNNPGISGSGGSAGFPSKGNPNKFIQIYGLGSYSMDVNEHVITHEIGHSVGLRHSDWSTRQSCGGRENEGSGTLGAIPIPGTPAGYDSSSLMLACFSPVQNGEFNVNDIKALKYLY
jgi:Dual-action HEIGH metallo-peptidase